jgi:hypothetical protein
MSPFKLVAAIALTLAGLPATNLRAQEVDSPLSAEEIDQRLARFVPDNPYDKSIDPANYESRAPVFLNTLSSGQLRSLLDRYKRTFVLRMVPFYVARIIGKREGKAAVVFIADHSSPEVRNAVGSAIRQWARADPDAAFNWTIDRFGPGEDLSVVLHDTRRFHPDKLVRMLASPALKDSAVRRKALSDYGIDLIRQNPKQGLDWLSKLPKADHTAVAPELITELARVLPAQTAEIAAALPGSNRHAAIMKVIGFWTLSNPEEVLTWVAELQEERLRRNCRWLALAIWADLDASGAWKHVSSLPAAEAMSLLQESSIGHLSFIELTNGSSIDSFNRFAYVTLTPQPLTQPSKDGSAVAPPRRRLRSILGNWRDMVARSLSGDPLYEVMLSRLSAKDSASLFEFIISKSTDAELVQKLTERRAKLLAIENAKKQGFEFPTPLSENDMAVVSATIPRLVQANPAAAFKLALSLEQRRTDWITYVVNRWTSLDPSDALAYFKSMAAGADRDTALKIHKEILHELKHPNDPAAARTAYKSQPPSPQRDTAFREYIRVLLKQTPASTAAKELDQFLAEQEFDPRKNLADVLIAAWIVEDPNALARWAKTKPESLMRYRALREFWEHWEKYGAGVGTERLEALGIKDSEIRSSRF